MHNLNEVKTAGTCVPALVVDFADMACFEVSVLDLNDTGCWIVSDKVDCLKDEVGLRLEGFDKLVRGTVIAFGDNEARISFQSKPAELGDLRREIRRPVWIAAVVCGKTSSVSMKCRIVDASKSGWKAGI